MHGAVLTWYTSVVWGLNAGLKKEPEPKLNCFADVSRHVSSTRSRSRLLTSSSFCSSKRSVSVMLDSN